VKDKIVKYLRSALSVFILIIAAVSFTPACDGPPRELLQKPRREYRGLYLNQAFHYSVTVPKGVAGYDTVNPLYQTGFVVVFGDQPQSYITLFAEPNSLEDASSGDVAKREPDYLRRKGKTIKSASITSAHLGRLPASRIRLTYACQGSTERHVQVSVFALSPSKSIVYEISLYANAGGYAHGREVLSQLLKSWKYTGH
jgi:hypothetical protein